MAVAGKARKRSLETVGSGCNALAVHYDSRPASKNGAQPSAIRRRTGYESKGVSLWKQGEQFGATRTTGGKRAAASEWKRPALTWLAVDLKKQCVTCSPQ
jgi:hypothetical protein